MQKKRQNMTKVETQKCQTFRKKKNKTFKKFNIDELTVRLSNPSKARYFKNKQKQQTL